VADTQTLVAILRKRKTTRMKTLLILIISFSTLLTLGQETKEVKVKFPKSKQVMESYFVLKSNPDIKNGKYTRFYKTSKNTKAKVFIKEKGTYQNGQKNGKWTYYRHPSQNQQGEIISVEFYNNGNKTGIWETHKYENGDHIIQKFNYDQETEIDTEIFIELKYPPMASELGIEGDVIVKYKIKPDCTFENIEIIKSLNTDCDNEVIRRFNRLSELQRKYGNKNCEEKEMITTVKFSLMK
jgi:hypothetical protein